MPKYRFDLPQLKDRVFLSDGGLETTLIFHDGIQLPHFASYVLLETEEGRERLKGSTRNTSRSRRNAASASSWTARPGAPIRTGVWRSVTAPRS